MMYKIKPEYLQKLIVEILDFDKVLFQYNLFFISFSLQFLLLIVLLILLMYLDG